MWKAHCKAIQEQEPEPTVPKGPEFKSMLAEDREERLNQESAALLLKQINVSTGYSKDTMKTNLNALQRLVELHELCKTHKELTEAEQAEGMADGMIGSPATEENGSESPEDDEHQKPGFWLSRDAWPIHCRLFVALRLLYLWFVESANINLVKVVTEVVTEDICDGLKSICEEDKDLGDRELPLGGACSGKIPPVINTTVRPPILLHDSTLFGGRAGSTDTSALRNYLYTLQQLFAFSASQASAAEQDKATEFAWYEKVTERDRIERLLEGATTRFCKYLEDEVMRHQRQIKPYCWIFARSLQAVQSSVQSGLESTDYKWVEDHVVTAIRGSKMNHQNSKLQIVEAMKEVWELLLPETGASVAGSFCQGLQALKKELSKELSKAGATRVNQSAESEEAFFKNSRYDFDWSPKRSDCRFDRHDIYMSALSSSADTSSTVKLGTKSVATAADKIASAVASKPVFRLKTMQCAADEYDSVSSAGLDKFVALSDKSRESPLEQGMVAISAGELFATTTHRSDNDKAGDIGYGELRVRAGGQCFLVLHMHRDLNHSHDETIAKKQAELGHQRSKQSWAIAETVNHISFKTGVGVVNEKYSGANVSATCLSHRIDRRQKSTHVDSVQNCRNATTPWPVSHRMVIAGHSSMPMQGQAQQL
jgi:hypothetical protein